MDHRKNSIEMLRYTGLIPVKVRPNQKDPFPDWDPRKVNQEDHQNTLQEFQNRPELNIGALFAGRFVDVDIDCDDPVLHQALNYFLPKTPWTWGRASSRNSHRVYALNEDFDRSKWGPVLRLMKSFKVAEQPYSIEVRGGKHENGLFSVLPGSVHPSGEAYEWAENFDPSTSMAVIDDFMLLKLLRMSMAVAVMSPYWVEGARNDMSLCLAGLLWRIRSTTLAANEAEDEHDLDPNIFVLSADDAKAVFDAIVKFSDDDPADKRSRLLNYKNTWSKLNADPSAKVTGGKAMADIIGGTTGEAVVRAMYRLLSDNEGIEQLEMLSEQFVIWYGQGVLVDLAMVRKGITTPWMNREQARNSLGSRKIKLGDKKFPVSNLLFTAQAIQRVYGLTLDPSTEEQVVDTDTGLMVNQFRGFAIPPCKENVDRADVQPFLDYVLEIVADGDPEIQHWVLSWIADMFQDPKTKPGTALVLVGPQGAGKSFLGEGVIGPIIGTSHYAMSNNITDLTSSFNIMMDNKVFMQCDEATHSHQKVEASRLKSLITDKYMRIEPKGVNAYHKPNYIRFLFTSNLEQAAVFIDPSPFERRFTVLKVSGNKASEESIPWWAEFRAWTEKNLPQLHKFFLEYKYDKKLIRRPIDTEAKRELQRVGVDLEVSWIINRVASGFPLAERNHRHWWDAYSEDQIEQVDMDRDTLRRDVWPTIISLKALEDDFRAYIRTHGRPVFSGNVQATIRRALPPGSVQFLMQKRVGYIDSKTSQKVEVRERLYSWPDTDSILGHLKAKFGPVVDELIRDAKRTREMEAFDNAEEEKAKKTEEF